MHMYVDFYLPFLVLLHSELSSLSICQFLRFSATVTLGILTIIFVVVYMVLRQLILLLTSGGVLLIL